MPQRQISELIQNQTILTVAEDTDVGEAARQMKRHKVGAAMVVRDGRLVGIFTERDALFRVIAPGLDPRAVPLSRVMTPDPMTITADKRFAHALHMMYENDFRHVPVVDNGRPVGIVSARDALGREVMEFGSELCDREHVGEILG